MAAPRKYPEELKERATRLCVDARADASTRRGAIARIAKQLDIHPEALRTWVHEVEQSSTRPAPAAQTQGEVTDERRRILELEAELRKVKRANTILRQAATYVGDVCQAGGWSRRSRRLV